MHTIANILVLYATSMNSYILTNDGKELIAKLNKGTFVFFGVLWIFMLSQPVYNYNKTLELFNKHPVSSSFVYLLVIGAGIFFWYNILSNGVRLVINKDGLWSRSSSLITWNELYYYHLVKTKHQNKIIYIMKFQTHESDKIYSIDLTHLNKSYDEIIDAIQNNTTNAFIQYLGLDDKT